MVLVKRITPKRGVYVPGEVMALLYEGAIDAVSFAFLCGLMDAPDDGHVEHSELTARLGYGRCTWANVARVLRRNGALADRIARKPCGGGFVSFGLKVRWPSSAAWPVEWVGDLVELVVDEFGRVRRSDRVTVGPESGRVTVGPESGRFTVALDSGGGNGAVHQDRHPKTRDRKLERGAKGRFVSRAGRE